jgi:tetratricopeptide (TPR) repeat protein
MKKYMSPKKIILVIALVAANIGLYKAQPKNKPGDPAEAKEHFTRGNYLFAMRSYTDLVKKDPKNIDYNYKLALCYLNTNVSKKQAIQYLEVVTKQKDADNEAWFDLGRAYQYANRFDDAIKAYTKYEESAKGKDQQKAERQLEMCKNGKELSKFPLNVTFENLGKEINSEYPDYYPFITADESFIVFTSRREENLGGGVEVDGYYSSDIYLSTVKNGIWTKAKNVGAPVNTRYDEQAVSLTSDGKNMIVYLDHIDSLGNLYIAPENKRNFQKLIRLNDNVNSKSLETSGSITVDGNILFFASDRPGGFGGTDIYMSKKLPNGLWALPQNLGPSINTKYNEDFPRLADDGRTLYFSSQGHSSMGDFDVFKAIWDEENNKWSAPKNLGFPINDGGDNRSISPTANEKVIYLSAVRDKGFGDLDIYRVTYNDAEQRYTVIAGYVMNADTANKKIEATITATDMKTKKEYTYTPTAESGRYVMALNPGKYTITIESPGHKLFIDAIELFDMASFKSEISKNFQLLKEGTSNTIPPQNNTANPKK